MAYTERVVGTIRREALDPFIIISRKQVRKIVNEYVNYYNRQRPRQGIIKIPVGEIYSSTGIIKKERILDGQHHNYYRSSA